MFSFSYHLLVYLDGAKSGWHEVLEKYIYVEAYISVQYNGINECYVLFVYEVRVAVDRNGLFRTKTTHTHTAVKEYCSIIGHVWKSKTV